MQFYKGLSDACIPKFTKWIRKKNPWKCNNQQQRYFKMNVRLFWKVLAALQIYLKSCEEQIIINGTCQREISIKSTIASMALVKGQSLQSTEKYCDLACENSVRKPSWSRSKMSYLDTFQTCVNSRSWFGWNWQWSSSFCRQQDILIFMEWIGTSAR